MTGWGQRPAAIAAVQWAQASDASSTQWQARMNCPAAAKLYATSGWQWSFQIRSADGASGASSTDAKAEHPTRRSRKLARLEAVLLVADSALSFRKISQFATLADAAEARELVQELNDKLDRGGAAFRIEKVATGVRMMTRPQFSMWLDRLHNRQARAKLSSPMLETLSIVAYRQPVTRADVDKIRGVQASEMLRQLMDRGLIRITGEDDSLGRPYLYGTTKQFLEEYGFGGLDDLPMADTLRRRDEPAEADESEEPVEEDAPQLFVEDEDQAEEEESPDESDIESQAEDSEDDSELEEDDESEDEEWDEDDEDDDEEEEDEAA
ncbi:MAG: SMC-Scp complex subunit ScpB [Planctomycetales bacterium]|jgi:segregation and condensation protein B